MNTGILVALIAAFASFIGLVISKETKISEFRQIWINDLRNAIAELLAAIDELRILSFSNNNSMHDMATFAGGNRALYAAIIRSIYSIKLRLNPNDSDQILDSLTKLENIICAQGTKDNDLDPVLSEFRINSHQLLKKEWDRVKRGEFWYFWTKVIIIPFIVFLVIIFLVEAFCGSGIMISFLKCSS